MEMEIIKGLAQESRKNSFILTALVIGSFISIYQAVSLNAHYLFPGYFRYGFDYSAMAHDRVHPGDGKHRSFVRLSWKLFWDA